MTTIWVTFQQEGWHRWPQAPKHQEYLSVRHRHMFHFRVEVEVNHTDRMVEFHWLKQRCQQLLWNGFARSEQSLFGLEFESLSCEGLANWMLGELKPHVPSDLWMACEVSEDGECGARVELKAIQ